MKFCLAHFRWEVWIDGLCYAWLTGEADELDQRYFYRHFLDLVFNKPVAIMPLDPQPEGCRFDTRIRERANA